MQINLLYFQRKENRMSASSRTNFLIASWSTERNDSMDFTRRTEPASLENEQTKTCEDEEDGK